MARFVLVRCVNGVPELVLDVGESAEGALRALRVQAGSMVDPVLCAERFPGCSHVGLWVKSVGYYDGVVSRHWDSVGGGGGVGGLARFRVLDEQPVGANGFVVLFPDGSFFSAFVFEVKVGI